MAQPTDTEVALAQVQARIPVEHLRVLDEEATKYERTISAEVRIAVRNYVESLAAREEQTAA